MARWSAVVVCLALAACVRPSDADEASVVREATITLDPATCAGVVVGDARHVITAAHCATVAGARVGVSFYDQRQLTGTYEIVDHSRDVALIRLDRFAPVHALQLADDLPEPGSPVLFTSRMEHPGVPQLASIERLAPCPSLPEVPLALHTSLRGRPGDSGGPVVTLDGRVVGLVHGGARCSIAAPTASFAPILRRTLEADNRQVPATG